MEWMVYCIVNEERTKTRFIIIRGLNDEYVKAYLKPGEFIDEINTLDGLLDGHAIIIER